MPARDVARILNNESNLKILDKLKSRPYYPRELAQEMELSEPFVVRRLKAMEEEDIVEGRWETMGSRKVKRYYLKDVKIEYGREGLKVSSEELPAPPVRKTIDMKKEMMGRLLKLPLVLVFLGGILLNIPAVLVVMLAILLWYLALTVAFYRRFRFTTSLLSIPIYLINGAILLVMLATDFYRQETPLGLLAAIFAIGLIYILLYHARFYQIELDDMLKKTRGFIKELDDAPVHVKLLYLPMVVKWKLSEYFKIV